MNRVIFASYGNDSIALIQWAHEAGLTEVEIAYSDTGWAADWWHARVEKAENWAESLGFKTHRISSEGMEKLIFRKKAWPRGGGGKFQFCTKELKELPALRWLDEIDPHKEVTCMVGIRREESRNRAQFPEYIEESGKHGGRSLHAPLVRYLEKDRNALISKTPFTPLPHRSKECFPCVNANQADLASLDGMRIEMIAELERRMGINSKGNPRVMFSPARAKGAIGIKAVVKWANGDIGGQESLFGCDSGWCED